MLLIAGSAVTHAQTGGTLLCESADGEFHRCEVYTQGYVRLVKQLSQAPCEQGTTWGYDPRSIWVDQGCRAEFAYGRSSTATTRQSTRTGTSSLLCESTAGQYRYCQAPTRGYAAVKRQLSRTACLEGQNWGYDAYGIWVSDDCRADFAYGGSATQPNAAAPNAATAGSLTCESIDNQYKHCPARTQGSVRLTQQLSRQACVKGDSWGYDNNGIWVQGGCRAVFEYGAQDNSRTAYVRQQDAVNAASVVPSWLIGAFRGYNPLYDAGMQLNIDAAGKVVAYVEGARLNGRYDAGKLVVGGVEYTVRRETDGFRTIQENNPSNQVIYSRVR